MSCNIIIPSPKKSYVPSEKVEKSGGGLYDINEPVVTNTDTVDKEGKLRNMLLRMPTHLLYQQN